MQRLIVETYVGPRTVVGTNACPNSIAQPALTPSTPIAILPELDCTVETPVASPTRSSGTSILYGMRSSCRQSIDQIVDVLQSQGFSVIPADGVLADVSGGLSVESSLQRRGASFVAFVGPVQQHRIDIATLIQRATSYYQLRSKHHGSSRRRVATLEDQRIHATIDDYVEKTLKVREHEIIRQYDFNIRVQSVDSTTGSPQCALWESTHQEWRIDGRRGHIIRLALAGDGRQWRVVPVKASYERSPMIDREHLPSYPIADELQPSISLVRRAGQTMAYLGHHGWRAPDPKNAVSPTAAPANANSATTSAAPTTSPEAN